MPPVPPLNSNQQGPKKPFNWGRFSKTLSFWVLNWVACFHLACWREGPSRVTLLYACVVHFCLRIDLLERLWQFLRSGHFHSQHDSIHLYTYAAPRQRLDTISL